MRISRADTSRAGVRAALNRLQAECFLPRECLDPAAGAWWLAHADGEPVAFAALLPVLTWAKTAYLARSGVSERHRGQGIQKRLIQRREQFAKAQGYARVITTTYNNPASANSLISRGFRTYLPEGKWGAADTIYWMKRL